MGKWKMQLSIYNHYNKLVNIDLPDKPIRSIFVLVFSDNETGRVEFEDGSTLGFSANGSDPRVPDRYDYYGDCYTVSSDMIPQWMVCRPCVRAWESAAHERYVWYIKACKRRDWFGWLEKWNIYKQKRKKSRNGEESDICDETRI